MSYQTPPGFRGKVHDPSAKHELVLVFGNGGQDIWVTCQCKKLKVPFHDLRDAHDVYDLHVLNTEGTVEI